MAQNAQNPFATLGLARWIFDDILPVTIPEWAKVYRDTFARCLRPDTTTDQKKASLFRVVQSAYEAIIKGSDPERAEWLKTYLRSGNSTAMQKGKEILSKETRVVNIMRSALGECLLAQVQRGSHVSAWHWQSLPPCRILLAYAGVRANVYKVSIELEVKEDGSITCWEMEAVMFRRSDGIPNAAKNLPPGWVSTHGSNSNPTCHYLVRKEGTARPFPFRVMGSLFVDEVYFNSLREQHRSGSMVNRLPADDPFFSWGAGLNWDDVIEEERPDLRVSRFDPKVVPYRAGDLLLSRFNESGKLRFWLVGPIKAVHIAGTPVTTEPDESGPVIDRSDFEEPQS